MENARNEKGSNNRFMEVREEGCTVYIGSGREEVHLGRRLGETEVRKKMAGAYIRGDERGGGENAHNENFRKKGQGMNSCISDFGRERGRDVGCTGDKGWSCEKGDVWGKEGEEVMNSVCGDGNRGCE